MERIRINCPYCNTEYLPGEIFLPKHFLGQPKNVERDYLGKILNYEGTIQDLTEKYVCDKCRSIFSVGASIHYTVKKEYESKNEYRQKI